MAEQLAASASTQAPATVDVTRSDALAAIDFEAARIAEEEQRPGWTRWGLVAAIAALLWGASAEFSAHAIVATTLVAWMLLGALALDAFWRGPKRPHDGASRAHRYIVASRIASVVTAESIVPATRIAALAGACWRLGVLEPWARDAVYAHAATSVVCLVVVLPILAHTHAPIPAAPQKFGWGLGISLLVFVAVPLVALVGAVRAIWPLGFREGLPELRIAALLIAASVLLQIAIAFWNRSSLLDELRHIRREIAFGRLHPIAGLAQADIAIHGMEFKDAIRPLIGTVLTSIQRCGAELRSGREKIDALWARVPADSPEASASDRLLIESTANEAQRHLNEYDKLLKRVIDGQAELSRLLASIGFTFEDLMDHRKELMEGVNRARNELDGQRARLSSAIADARSRSASSTATQAGH